MEKQIFGATDIEVARIGQGTWNLEKSNLKQVKEAVHHGIDLGMTHIDTAEMYGNGAVERVLGQVLRGIREKVFLVSKVLPKNATYEGTIQACESSLRRMGTDHLDCYLLHWHEEHPLEGTLQAFEKLLSDGKIKSFGVSNFSVAELQTAIDIVGPNKIACNQVEYFLQNREIEKDLIPFCQQNKIAVVAYSPFGDKRFPGPFSRGGRALKLLGQEQNVSSRCVALRFLMQKGGVFVIPKAAKRKHIEDNAKAGRFVLSANQMAEIEKLFPANL
ncbi:MAG: aldo/keto reductase [Myxococcota bacterium]|nr:aldo/keto reductase [Myxococcota bacterium]